jgi:four helix bundle protein
MAQRKKPADDGIQQARLCSVNPKTEELKARTKRFALKSGTAVAANYRSACRSRSHAEFIARIGVVLEKADESELWSELLAESGVARRGADLKALMDESRQLRAIFVAANLTARSSP